MASMADRTYHTRPILQFTNCSSKQSTRGFVSDPHLERRKRRKENRRRWYEDEGSRWPPCTSIKLEIRGRRGRVPATMYLINVTGARGAAGLERTDCTHKPPSIHSGERRVTPTKLHPRGAPLSSPIRSLVQWPPSRELKLKI